MKPFADSIDLWETAVSISPGLNLKVWQEHISFFVLFSIRIGGNGRRHSQQKSDLGGIVGRRGTLTKVRFVWLNGEAPCPFVGRPRWSAGEVNGNLFVPQMLIYI